MELITGLGWAFFFGIALMAYPAIRILYGPQWDDAVDPARWLAIACAFAIPAAICPPVLIAVGAINDVLKATLISTIVTLAATVVGVFAGLLALSQCLIVSGAIASVIWIYTARKHISFATGEILFAWGKSMLVALGASAASVVVILNWGWRSTELLVPALLSGTGGILGALLLAWVTKHRLWLEISRVWLSGKGRR